MSFALSPPIGRALALAILVGLVGAAYYGIAAPLLDEVSSTEESIAQLRDALGRYERAGRSLDQRQAELTALKARQSTADGFLQGANETLVAAEIQNRIKTLAEQSKGELKSTQILPPQEEGKFRRITVRSQMTLKLAAAQRVFYGLEASMPMLFLDNVNLRARSDRRTDEAGDDPVLDIRFDVYGYTRGGK
jgi:general secretion pathway protein M